MPHCRRPLRVLSCALMLLAALPSSGRAASIARMNGDSASGEPRALDAADPMHISVPEDWATRPMETGIVEPVELAQRMDDTLADGSMPIQAEKRDLSAEEMLTDFSIVDYGLPDSWSWQWLPTGLIYHSYMAGVHEPRMAIVAFHEGADRTLWDATLGGRVGLWRFGDCDPVSPQGYQLDFYGAAVARLDVENGQDLDSTDYVFGFPLTYGIDSWQFKFGYAHLSSHMGDELALREPGTLDERVNYVRDSLVLGASCYPHPAWRQYAEFGWGFHLSGGAQPWEMQFGSEFSQPGPTGQLGTPYLAVHGRMREEHNYGGDVSVQAGWLRRGLLHQTLRIGLHYYNGKASQFQFYDNSEEQIGLGLWYDF